jgi:hypothetical protein
MVESKKVYSKIVFDFASGDMLSADWHTYSGPVALCADAGEGEGGLEADSDSIVPDEDFEEEGVTVQDFEEPDLDDEGVDDEDDEEDDDEFSMLEKFIGEKLGTGKKPAPEEFEAPDGLSEDASKRFQELANQNRETREQISRFQQENTELRSWGNNLLNQARGEINRRDGYIAQLSGELKAVRTQVESLMGQVAMPQNGQEPDGADQFGQNFIERGRAAFKEMLESQVKPLQEELATLKEEKKKSEFERARQNDVQAQRRLALESTNELLGGFLEEDRHEVGPLFAALAAANAVQTGTDIPTGAKALQEWAYKFAAAVNRSAAAHYRKSRQRSEKVPKRTSPGRKASGKLNKLPSPDKLDEMGEDELSFMIKKDSGRL